MIKVAIKINSESKRATIASGEKMKVSPEALDSHTVLELLQYKAITKDKNNFIILKDKDDGYAEMLSIRGQGVGTMAGRQQVEVIEGYMSFLRAYLEDSKAIISPFPANTAVQQRYASRMYTKVAKELNQEQDQRTKQQMRTRLRYINDQLQTNVKVEKELFNQEFILLIFGKNVRQLMNNRDNAVRWGGSALILEPMNRKRKEEALFRINNMNTKIR